MDRLIVVFALLAAGCVGEDFEEDLFTGGAGGGGGGAGAAGSAGGSDAGHDAEDAPACDDGTRVVICSSEGSCPEGWHLAEWLETPCGGSDTYWACERNCEPTFVQCGADPVYPQCPKGWASLGFTFVEGCGIESPNNAQVCGKEQATCTHETIGYWCGGACPSGYHPTKLYPDVCRDCERHCPGETFSKCGTPISDVCPAGWQPKSYYDDPQCAGSSIGPSGKNAVVCEAP